MSSRRKFIQTTAAGATAAMLAPLVSTAESHALSARKPSALKLGIAGYTFLHFDIPESIAMMKRVDIHNVSLKDFHLPLDSSPEKIKSVLQQFSKSDIKVYTLGVIYMKTKEVVDQAFTYAKRAGVTMIVAVPTYDLLDYTEQKVKESGIRVAIHNHGPEDKLYPAPEDVYNRIKNRDPRMGLCLDIGHAKRAGTDLPKAIKEYHKRIFDMHIKDVTGVGKDGKAIEVGRGIIDFPAVIKSLERVHYSGCCSFEFEKDMKDPLPGLAESIGFFKGVMSAV